MPSLQLENQMFRDMEKAYRAMPQDQKDAFDAAMTAAKAENGSRQIRSRSSITPRR